MDIYEATQALLSEAVQDANVTYYLLTYDEQKDQFDLPDFPAVTYLFSNLAPVIDHDGTTGLFRVMIDVEVWGTLEDVSRLGGSLLDAVDAQRINVQNVCFTVVAQEVRDIYDMGIDFHHKLIRFGGLVEVDDEQPDPDYPDYPDYPDDPVEDVFVGVAADGDTYKLLWSGPLAIEKDNDLYYLNYVGVARKCPFSIEIIGTDYVLIREDK